jgi:hypothetical protein
MKKFFVFKNKIVREVQGIKIIRMGEELIGTRRNTPQAEFISFTTYMLKDIPKRRRFIKLPVICKTLKKKTRVPQGAI